MSLFVRPTVIVDIETTGTSAKRGGITEVAALKVIGNEIVDDFTRLIKPDMSIPSYITRLTGIDNAMVAQAPAFEDIADELLAFFEGADFMAHHAVFDMSFIKEHMRRAGHSFAPRMLCSVKLSRALYPQAKSHSLENILKRHNIATKDRHRAYDDAKAVYDFLLIAQAEHGQDRFNAALKKQEKATTLPPHFDASQLEGVGNTPGVYIFKDKTGHPVYIGKSKTLRTRILSHFSQATTMSKELRISQSTHSLETLPADSEVEALLLESRLIKQELPVYNIRLRAKRQQTILTRSKNKDGYYECALFDKDLAELDDPTIIFGVYSSRRSAKEVLVIARDANNLCSKLLGIENTKGACFHYQLGKCKGACNGKEPTLAYNDRLDTAFAKSRVATWKNTEPIVVKVSDRKALIIDKWVITGEVVYEDDQPSVNNFADNDPRFSIDDYRIIYSYMRKHPQAIFLLSEIEH